MTNKETILNDLTVLIAARNTETRQMALDIVKRWEYTDRPNLYSASFIDGYKRVTYVKFFHPLFDGKHETILDEQEYIKESIITSNKLGDAERNEAHNLLNICEGKGIFHVLHKFDKIELIYDAIEKR